jgi:Protein of unknown function (DUF1570)
MQHVICSSCRAGFDVDFAPGTEFTCGGCGAVVVVPAAPRPAPPVIMPRAAPPPRPSPAAPPRSAPPPRPPRSEPRPQPPPVPLDPAAAHRQKKLVMAVVGGTALVVVVLGALVLFGPGPSTPPEEPPTARPSPVGDSAAAPGAASQPEAATRPADPARAARSRPSDPIGAARFDSEQENATALDHLKFADLAYERAEQLDADNKRFEAAALRTEALIAYGEVLKREPDQERARTRLGFVKYDPAEAKKLSELQYIPRKLKAEVVEIIEQVDQRPASKRLKWPAWLNVKGGEFEDIAGEWRRIYRDAKQYEELEASKLTDPFFKRADAIASAIEGDVGPLLKRKKLEGPTFDVHPRKPYVLLVQRDKDYDTQMAADYWVDVLQQLRETFLARFRKLNLKPMEEPTAVVVLRYDTEYTKYVTRGEGGAFGSLAHFEPFSKRLVTWKDVNREDYNPNEGPSEDGIRTVVFHEGTHQLIEYFTKAPTPDWGSAQALWFAEGIADYFGGHGRTWDETAGKWRYEPGLINTERLQQIHLTKGMGALLPLENLLEYRRRDYEKDLVTNAFRARIAYAQGWALIYFLSTHEGEKYRDRFDEYVRKELAGESGSGAFEAVFGQGSIDTIEKGLLEMIDVLGQALKDKKILNGRLQK